MRRISHAVLTVVMLAMMTAATVAQNPPATTTAPDRPKGFDQASIREFIMDRLKAEVGASNEEWKLLEPKLVKIFLLQLDISGMGNMMRVGRGAMAIRTMLDPNALPSQIEEKTRELQEIIDNHETSTDLYKTKMAQLRKAREKAKEDLAAAQKDLTPILTVRQEARLVQLGLLD